MHNFYHVGATYDKGRFKKAFRVSRQTFDFILDSIRPNVKKIPWQRFLFHPNVSSFSSATEQSTLTQILFPQVMQEYLVFLLQIVERKAIFSSTNWDMTGAKKTYEVGKVRETWVQRHCLRKRHERNEPRAYHGLIIIMYAFNSMRLLRYV